MKTAEKILKSYLKTFAKPTLRELSEDSGIQLTRLFRLLNGQEMKVSELEILQRRLQARSINLDGLDMLWEKTRSHLDPASLRELEIFLQKHKRIADLKNNKCEYANNIVI